MIQSGRVPLWTTAAARPGNADTGRVASTVGTITERVRARVRRDGVDLSADRAAAVRYVRDEVQRYSEHALGGGEPLLGDEEATESAVLASLTGFGPLQPLLDDEGVEEIWINSPTRVFAARDGVAELTPVLLEEGRCATWSSGCCSPPAVGSTCLRPSWTRPCQTGLGSTW
ncbi:hypothetical protein GCM10025866_02750 [Naasia aerilata]|uniref:Bacterial type II secretion system protein E domain-containing protein n=1 Tax=Naasia aerilata TaxID=1162966 RepID=A0ABM8G863_9MICO|nr:hypothetical protein GCM10025866_02750 [Naasia aerilata]